MKHTYFYSTLDWRARGTYYDAAGKESPLYGEVSIVRNEREWVLSGFMEVRSKERLKFSNDYKIQNTSDDTTLRWTSYNPALGTLKGTFEVVGNTIISYYHSDDFVYSGTEMLTWKDDFTYYNVGVSFANGKKMSSWTATLKGRKVRKMEEYNTEFCKVKYKQEDNAVLLVWRKFACGEDYRKPTTYAWKIFEETGACNYIVDARNGFEDEKEDVKWVVETLLPGMAKTSCKNVCFIMNEVNEIEEEMDFWTQEFSKYFKVIKATTYEEALKRIL